MTCKRIFENIWIGVLVHETDLSSPDAELTMTFFEGLHECIHSGLRRRFLSITKSMLYSWTMEQSKTIDFSKDFNVNFDSNVKGLGLSDSDLIFILTLYLKKLISEKKDAKLLLSLENDEKVDASINGTASKGKAKDKLAGKSKIVHIDDEPQDGPELYIILQNFDESSIIEAIFQSKLFPIHAMTLLMNIPNITHTLERFESLKTKFQSYPYEAACAFTRLSCCTLPNSIATFDIIALHWYQLVELKLEYEKFYASCTICEIPDLEIVPTASEMLNDTSELKIWLDFVIEEACSYFNTANSGEFEFRIKSLAPSKYISRFEKLLMPFKDDTDKCLTSKVACFAKLMNIDPFLASYYLDLNLFEKMLNQQLDAFVWKETVSRNQLFKRMDSALAYTPLSQTFVTARGSKVFFALKSNEQGKNIQWTIPIPRKHAFGVWYDLKMRKSSINSKTQCYDFGNMCISGKHHLANENCYFTAEHITTLSNPPYLRIGNRQLLCTIYPNQCLVSFPHCQNKIFIQAFSSLCTPSCLRQVVFLTSNGWLCYRSSSNQVHKHKGAERKESIQIEKEHQIPIEDSELRIECIQKQQLEESSLCIIIPSHAITSNAERHKDSSNHIHWRKICKNGDQWLNVGQEVHFYGHDGIRGFKSSDSSTSTSWTWFTSSGEVWRSSQSVSQLRMTRQTDLESDTTCFWREDLLDSMETRNRHLRKYPDGTVLATRPENIIEICIPYFGCVTLQNGNFHIRDIDGSEILFSKKIMYTTPSGFPIFIDEISSQVKFEGCNIDLVTREVKKNVDNPLEPSEHFSMKLNSRIVSQFNAPWLPFEPLQLFAVDENEGTLFHTHQSFCHFIRSASGACECILESEELGRQCFQFGGKCKATKYPSLTPSLRANVTSIWSSLYAVQYCPSIATQDPTLHPELARKYISKKNESERQGSKQGGESENKVSWITKSLPIVPNNSSGSSPHLFVSPFFPSETFRNDYITLSDPSSKMGVSIASSAKTSVPTPNRDEKIYTFEGVFKKPNAKQKGISWEKDT